MVTWDSEEHWEANLCLSKVSKGAQKLKLITKNQEPAVTDLDR